MPNTTNSTSILQTLLSSDYSFVVLKAAILLLLILYAVFALIIVRQVDLMGQTLISGISKLIKLISVIHLVFVLGLIILAWSIL